MKPQINSLTSTRAFAALMVFIFHFGRGVAPFNKLPSLFSSGNIGVGYFFVLSGFVLFISYWNTRFTYLEFMRKRLLRIGAAYYLALGLFLIVALYLYGMPWSAEFTRQFLYCFFFIQAYIPGYALVLNTAAWSLSVEMFFYLMFPLLLVWQHRSARMFAIGAAAIWAVTQVVFLMYGKGDYNQLENFTFFNYSPLMHINEFMIGMAGGYLFMKGGVKKVKGLPVPLIILCAIVGLFILQPVSAGKYHAGMLAPLFLLLILSIAVHDPKFLNWRPFVFLGEISYGIYILQFPVRELLMNLNVHVMKLDELPFFLLALATLCLTATLSYYLLEQPIRKRFRRPATKVAQLQKV